MKAFCQTLLIAFNMSSAIAKVSQVYGGRKTVEQRGTQEEHLRIGHKGNCTDNQKVV